MTKTGLELCKDVLAESRTETESLLCKTIFRELDIFIPLRHFLD